MLHRVLWGVFFSCIEYATNRVGESIKGCSVLNKLTQLKRLCQVQLVIHYGLKL